MPLAPVGSAWSDALGEAPDSPLWLADGSHPTRSGSYLAASVLYATIFDRSPVDLDYTTGLQERAAKQLRQIAWRATEDRR